MIVTGYDVVIVLAGWTLIDVVVRTNVDTSVSVLVDGGNDVVSVIG